jgi:hypothetical protein
MHNLDLFLLSVLKLMVLPGLFVGIVWPLLGGDRPAISSWLSLTAWGAVGGLAGSLALAGLVATLQIEAWRGTAPVYVSGSVLGAVLLLGALATWRG